MTDQSMLRVILVGVPLCVICLVAFAWLWININHNAVERGHEHVAMSNISSDEHKQIERNQEQLYKEIQALKNGT